MKISIIILFFTFSNYILASENSHHHDHNSEKKSVSELKLDNGKKWPTDETLRSSMSTIHDLVKKNLHKVHKNSMSKLEYRSLGESIDKQIKTIFKNCKLPAKADAQLHIIMAGLIRANEILIKGSDSKEKKKAVESILNNYKSYLKYFDSSDKVKKS